jgi:hypothetical protein
MTRTGSSAAADAALLLVSPPAPRATSTTPAGTTDIAGRFGILDQSRDQPERPPPVKRRPLDLGVPAHPQQQGRGPARVKIKGAKFGRLNGPV